jgi:hypothetical protein
MQCPVQYIAVYSAVQCRAVQCRTLFLSWPPSAPLPGAGLDLGASVSGAAQNVLIAKLSAVSPPDECTALHFTALHSTAPPPVHMVHSGLDGLVLALAASLHDTSHQLALGLLPRWAVQCSAVQCRPPPRVSQHECLMLLTLAEGLGFFGLAGFGCLSCALQVRSLSQLGRCSAADSV